MTAERAPVPTRDPIAAGEAAYLSWRDGLVADFEGRALYEAEAAKMDVWLRLVETWQDSGLGREAVAARLGVSKARLKRIEQAGYDVCSAEELRSKLRVLVDGLRTEHEEPKPAGTPKPAGVPG